MTSAKDIVIKPIKAHVANRKCKEIHYSGKVVPNSQLHFGVFLNGKLEGVMQYGPSMMKSNVIGLVSGTGWNEFIELNRMAFSDALPRNSESRAIGITMRLIRKLYPQIKWVISFSDGTQCGDGTIYRASGFHLLAVKRSTGIWRLPSGEVTTRMAQTKGAAIRKNKGKASKPNGVIELEGFQLKYIYFIDKSYKEKLTVPILPFSDIDKVGAGMYKGERITLQERRVTKANSGDQSESGGAIPTNALQSSEGE